MKTHREMAEFWGEEVEEAAKHRDSDLAGYSARIAATYAAKCLDGSSGRIEATLTITTVPHLGKSVLTKDMWWCHCGRGLGQNINIFDIHERWKYCPHCGCLLDWDEALSRTTAAAEDNA